MNVQNMLILEHIEENIRYNYGINIYIISKENVGQGMLEGIKFSIKCSTENWIRSKCVQIIEFEQKFGKGRFEYIIEMWIYVNLLPFPS